MRVAGVFLNNNARCLKCWEVQHKAWKLTGMPLIRDGSTSA